ncbi:hypothetical protein DW691_22600, partial [Bacteroides xylanisolvens]|uniref:hypothetical protein n=1 Tax=Bacteroides xylanisolvens TaxID=371601 RepID=UPI000FF3B2C8
KKATNSYPQEISGEPKKHRFFSSKILFVFLHLIFVSKGRIFFAFLFRLEFAYWSIKENPLK